MSAAASDNPAPGQSATCGPGVSEGIGRMIAPILAVLALLAGCGGESTTTTVPSGPTFAYVTDPSLGTITKIRSSDASIEATIPLSLVIDGAFLYVTTEGVAPDLGDDAVIAMDTSTYRVVATIPVKPRPDGVAISPTGFAYVVLGQSSAVVVIDTRTNSMTETLRLPRSACGDRGDVS